MNSSEHTLTGYQQTPFQDASGFDPAAVWSDKFLADVDDSIDFGDDADRLLVHILDEQPRYSDPHHTPAEPGRDTPHTTTSHLHPVG